MNQYGVTLTDVELFDELSLVYFGYTYCPDVCTIDVGRNVTAVEIAHTMGVKVKPVFITIDPARDTVSELADFAIAYHPDMVALTGTDAQIEQAAKAYRVYYRQTSEEEDYLFDHSSFTYLVGPDGFLEFFRRDMGPTEIADTMACFAKV